MILADLRAIQRWSGSSLQASEGVSEQADIAAPSGTVGDAVNLDEFVEEASVEPATTSPAQGCKRPADLSPSLSDKRPRLQPRESGQDIDAPRNGSQSHLEHPFGMLRPQVRQHVEKQVEPGLDPTPSGPSSVDFMDLEPAMSAREACPTGTRVAHHEQVNPGQRAPQAGGSAQQRRFSHLSQSATPSSSRAASYFSASCLRSIQAHLTSVGGLQALNPIEQSRIQLLEDAAKIQDRFYLTLHQLMCVSSVNVMLLPRELLTVPRQHLTTALQLMDHVLCPNRNLSRNTLLWFASFPVSTSNAVWSHVPELQKFMAFVSCAGQRWQSFQDCYARSYYPPLAHEIAEQLAIDSPIFQKVVFLAILRQIWGNGNSSWVNLAEDTFREDQQRYQLRKSQGNAATNPASCAEYSHVRQRYRELLVRHKEAVRPAYAVPPIGTPNLQGAMQPPTARIQINTNVPHVRSQRMESPTLTHIRSQTGYMQRTHQTPPNVRTVSVAVPMLQSQQSTYQVQPSIQQYQQGSIQQNVQQARLIQPVPSGAQIRQSIPSSAHSRQPVPSRQHAAQAPVFRQPSVSRPLFPATGESVSQPSHPNPAFSALHQAHLRSPILRPKQGGDWVADGPTALYQYVKSFAMSPQVVALSQPVQSRSFTVAIEDFALVPRDELSRDGRPPSRVIGEDSLTYRLRCSKIPSPGQVEESAWVITDNAMPSYFYPQINGKPLQMRRKLQHGKDLPIDVTPYIRAGDNLLEIFVNRTADEPSPTAYAFAIEVIGLKSHAAIKAECCTFRLIPSTQTLASINSSLSNTSPADDDDDLLVVSSTLTIDLFDPFSACRIFDIPVRGQSCLHRDCFDLETFLETRKRSQPGWPSAVDEWRCPLCKADVRPQKLVVDGFLVDVRAKLAEQGLLATRSIIVEADGSWRPKPEKAPRGSVGPESRDVTPVTEGAPAGPQVPVKEIGVISLGD